MIDDFGIGSVLDLGCAAGAFCHLLNVAKPHVEYFGCDLSAHQIARAEKLFGSTFAVRDISTMGVDEFSRFDAIHAFSVFSFMSADQQLSTFERMLGSGAKVLIETGVTLPHIDFAPQSCFKSFMNIDIEGKTLLTTVTFPFLSEVEALVHGTDHELVTVERTYPPCRALNTSGQAGGALANNREVRQRNHEFEAEVPFPSEWKYLTAKIRPRGWEPAADYSTMQRAEIEDRLQSIIGRGRQA